MMQFDRKTVSRRIALHTLLSGANFSKEQRARLTEIAMDGLDDSSVDPNAKLLEFLAGKLSSADLAKVKEMLGADSDDDKMIGLDHRPSGMLVHGTGPKRDSRRDFNERFPNAARIGAA